MGAFRTVCCLTKLSGKQAELVQMFVPRSCAIIFHNEHTRSTPLDSKLMFWRVSYLLGAFGTVWLPYETRWKTGRTSEVHATKLRRNFSQRTHPIHSNGPKTDVLVRFSYHLVHSAPFSCLTKLGAKWAELVQMFVPRSRVRIFHNKRTRSTPLDPKMTF